MIFHIHSELKRSVSSFLDTGNFCEEKNSSSTLINYISGRNQVVMNGAKTSLALAIPS